MASTETCVVGSEKKSVHKVVAVAAQAQLPLGFATGVLGSIKEIVFLEFKKWVCVKDGIVDPKHH